MTRDDIRKLFEPPQGQLGEDLAFIRNESGEHPVVRRHPVTRDEEQSIIRGGEEVANLPAVDMLVLGRQTVVHHRCRHHRMSSGR